jgi:hypothetical protein
MTSEFLNPTGVQAARRSFRLNATVPAWVRHWGGGHHPPAPSAPEQQAARHRLTWERQRRRRAWICTVRAECLDWLSISGRGHLEQVLWVYVAHDNHHRPTRALGLEPPDPPPAT